MTFFLRTFGALQLLDASKTPVPFPKKGLLLLAYLLSLDEGTESRAALAQLLWYNDDSAARLANLRKAISRIKLRQGELGVSLLLTPETMITVNRTVIQSDIALETGIPGAFSVDALKSLLAVIKQPFLGQLNYKSPDFSRWIGEQRSHAISILRRAVRDVSLIAHTGPDREILREAASFLFRVEPEDADTLHLLIEVFNAQGEVERLRAEFERRNDLIARGQRMAKTASVHTHQVTPGTHAEEGILATEGVDDTPGAHLQHRPIPRVVLLPPTNQSCNPAAGLIAASLIEDITIGFCAFNSLQVIAPHSAVRISLDLAEQANFFESHSVSYVLSTRISSFKNEVSLYVQLVFLEDDAVIWAERLKLEKLELAIDRKIILRHIGQMISSEIDRHQDALSYLEINPVAYHRYLVGKQHLGRLTLPNMRRARKELKSALQARGDFAPALSAVARTYSKEWLLTAQGDLELLKAAETYSARAMACRADSADGYREFGVAKLLQGAIDESAEAMDLAERLSPHYADVIADHADTLVHCSRPDVALQKIERAMELNPLSPDSYIWTAAGANYALGRFEETLTYIDQMADPALADRLSACSWAMLGETGKARTFVQRAHKANPGFDVQKWLAVIPIKEQWHRDLYKEGLQRAGF